MRCAVRFVRRALCAETATCGARKDSVLNEHLPNGLACTWAGRGGEQSRRISSGWIESPEAWNAAVKTLIEQNLRPRCCVQPCSPASARAPGWLVWPDSRPVPHWALAPLIRRYPDGWRGKRGAPSRLLLEARFVPSSSILCICLASNRQRPVRGGKMVREEPFFHHHFPNILWNLRHSNL